MYCRSLRDCHQPLLPPTDLQLLLRYRLEYACCAKTTRFSYSWSTGLFCWQDKTGTSSGRWWIQNWSCTPPKNRIENTVEYAVSFWDVYDLNHTGDTISFDQIQWFCHISHIAFSLQEHTLIHRNKCQFENGDGRRSLTFRQFSRVHRRDILFISYHSRHTK